VFTQALGTATTAFEGQFRFLSDIQGLGTSVGRHPSADLLPVFNASYRSLRELVTGYGYTQFVTRGATTALPTTAVEAGETYAVITTAIGLEQIKAFDVKYTTGEWDRLPEVTLLQLRDFARLSGPGLPATPARPRAWCWLDAGSVSAAAYTGGKIAVTPVPNGGSYALWAMNETTDVSATTDVFLYHTEDWRQWHMYSAMAKIVGARDKDTARKLEFVQMQLNPDIEGTPAFNIKNQAPTAAGPKTWTRSASYRGGTWG
jgi:hypothetical protein